MSFVCRTFYIYMNKKYIYISYSIAFVHSWRHLVQNAALLPDKGALPLLPHPPQDPQHRHRNMTRLKPMEWTNERIPLQEKGV